MHKFVKNFILKKYFVQYKLFLLFLGSFFGAYIVLTVCYQFFLNRFEGGKVDSVTRLVAQNTKELVSLFYQSIRIEDWTKEPFVRIYFQENYVVRIVEGCNGISVIILFVSFVLAFSGTLKNTLFYVFGGSLLIYCLNVLRIAFLIVLMYYFPDQKQVLHNVFFPVIIYGLVFVLWLIWVNKFSKYAK